MAGGHPFLYSNSRGHFLFQADAEHPRPGRTPVLEGLAAVENGVAQILEPKGGVVGPALGLFSDAGIGHLADEDGVVPDLDGLAQLALHPGRAGKKEGRARRAFFKCLAADAVAIALKGLEERKGRALLVLAKEVEGEDAAFVYQAIYQASRPRSPSPSQPSAVTATVSSILT